MPFSIPFSISFRRCFGESYYFLAESPSSLTCSNPNNGSIAHQTQINTPDVAKTGVMGDHPGVPIHLFTRHVLERHANENSGFVQAFEHMESLAASSSPQRKENLASLLPHNLEKNRYKNVLACMFRVKRNMVVRYLSKKTESNP